ncbi:MAG: hypothetical protein IJM59_08540 [Proteobacteria bacterium]|nr:hypothetical protein [Pseudomonadota bacterium]
MNKQLTLIPIAVFCVLSACSDNDININSDHKSCQISDFTPQCITPTKYTACENNTEVVKSCAGSATCSDGHCQLNETCASDSYTPVCLNDGHLSACSASGRVEPVDCGNKTCAVLNGIADCYELCTEEEIAAGPQESCEDEEEVLAEDIELGYHSVTSCVKTNGQYIKSTYTKTCYHGCDKETKQCRHYHPEEGKECDPKKDNDHCDADSIVECKRVSFNPDRYEWYAVSCRHMNCSCVEIMDENGHINPTFMRLCNPDYHEENRTCRYNQLIYSECLPSKGGYYERHQVYETCKHGCNEDGTDCIILHEDEGKDCGVDNGSGLEPGPSQCKGSILLECEQDKQSSISKHAYSYVAKDCTYGGERPSYTCDPTMGCYDPCKVPTVGENKVCDGENLYIETCKEDPKSNVKYIFDKRTKHCSHGCDADTNTCKLLHEDEGMECSNDENSPGYYPTKCVGNLLLSCGYTVNVEDCGSQACSAALGCYHACNTVGEKGRYCDYDRSIDAVCTEDEETKIKYLKKASSYTTCGNGCNESTGKCK